MDDWETFGETSLHEKEDFYSHLNMEDITEADYAHAKRVCKDFKIKNLREYYDLFVQSDALLLADIFEHFINMFLKIYTNLILRNFFQLLDQHEKAIRGRICYSIDQFEKNNNKYMEDYDESKEWSYIQYWD